MANLYLAKGSAKSLHEMIIYQSQTIYPLWNNMVDAIRSVGSNRKGHIIEINKVETFCIEQGFVKQQMN